MVSVEHLIRRARNLAQKAALASSSSKRAPKVSLERMASTRRTLINPTRACGARLVTIGRQAKRHGRALPTRVVENSVPKKDKTFYWVFTSTRVQRGPNSFLMP